MNFALLVGIACAVLFFRAADYERMNPWIWSVASLGLTGTATLRGASMPVRLLLQAALFGVLWWYNMRRKTHKPG